MIVNNSNRSPILKLILNFPIDPFILRYNQGEKLRWAEAEKCNFSTEYILRIRGACKSRINNLLVKYPLQEAKLIDNFAYIYTNSRKWIFFYKKRNFSFLFAKYVSRALDSQRKEGRERKKNITRIDLERCLVNYYVSR